MFRALGVFVDGFDLDAVAAVTGFDRRRATGHIEALQAKSLVVRADKRKVTRFRLLETVKAYAEGRLVDNGEAEAVRNRHLAHFHTLAMTEGRRVVPPLDVGLRLRHDCANLSTAFEWAAETRRWVTAAEILIGGQAAYILDARHSDLPTALARTASHVAASEPELHGCITIVRCMTSVLLDDWGGFLESVAELIAMPLRVFRSMGLGLSAWMMAVFEPEAHDRFLGEAEAELREADPSETSLSDARPVALFFQFWARQHAAMVSGDFERGADLSRDGSLLPGFFKADVLVTIAVCEVLLGRPESALTTVSKLDAYEFPFLDGTEVRALAFLALDEVDLATEDIRRHAKRAATGRFSRESNDAMVLLAPSLTATATWTPLDSSCSARVSADHRQPVASLAISPPNSASPTSTPPTTKP